MRRCPDSGYIFVPLVVHNICEKIFFSKIDQIDCCLLLKMTGVTLHIRLLTETLITENNVCTVPLEKKTHSNKVHCLNLKGAHIPLISVQSPGLWPVVCSGHFVQFKTAKKGFTCSPEVPSHLDLCSASWYILMMLLRNQFETWLHYVK